MADHGIREAHESFDHLASEQQVLQNLAVGQESIHSRAQHRRQETEHSFKYDDKCLGIDLQSIHPGSSILDSKSKELSDDRVKEVAQMPKMIHSRQPEKPFRMENSGALATSRNFNINSHKSQSSSKTNAMKVEGRKIKHFNLKNKSIQIT